MIYRSIQSFGKNDRNDGHGGDLLKIIDGGFILFHTLLMTSLPDEFESNNIRIKLHDAHIGETIKEVLFKGKQKFHSFHRKCILRNVLKTLQVMCGNVHVQLQGPIPNDEIANKLFNFYVKNISIIIMETIQKEKWQK